MMNYTFIPTCVDDGSVIVYVYVCMYACKLTKQLTTNSMEQCPWKANSFSASHEISRILWNLNVDYWIHDSLPPVPIQS